MQKEHVTLYQVIAKEQTYLQSQNYLSVFIKRVLREQKKTFDDFWEPSETWTGSNMLPNS